MIENITVSDRLYYLNPTITILLLIKNINTDGLVEYTTENKILYKGSNCFCSDWWYAFCKDNNLQLPEKPFTTCIYHDDCPWHPISSKRNKITTPNAIRDNLSHSNLYAVEDPENCPYSIFYDKRNATQQNNSFIVKKITASNNIYTFTNTKDETYIFGYFGYSQQENEPVG